MKYGVVVCRKCKKAKGILLSSKTTKCPRCGKTYEISKLKIFYKTNSSKELQNAIGALNAKIDGHEKEFKEFASEQ